MDLLAGIKVLDFTLAAVGPFCSRILADMGAEVIRVEYPREGMNPDGPTGRFTPEGLRADVLFIHCNGGKKSLAVNLKEMRGIELVWDLVKQVDVVVENFTPRVMRNFALDYDNLKARNPRIIMCSLTGFGQEGYDGDVTRPCTDPVAQAMSGLTWITGERNGAPYAIGGGIGDTITSLNGAIAILAALVSRNQTGVGQYIDLAMAEAAMFVDCTAMPYVAANNGKSRIYRNGQANTYTYPMGPFKTKDGYVALQAPGFGPASPWARLCEAMGRQDLVSKPEFLEDNVRAANAPEVIKIIEGWLANFTRDEALEKLAEARISSGPVLSQAEILEHRLFRSRGTFGTIHYPELGDVKVVEPPFKFSDADAYVRGPAPQFGEHNHDVLERYLKLSKSEIEELTRTGVLYESDSARLRNYAKK
ncbi:MAG TPA: CoA transferase [Candidatus Binataceae bacterium]|nr:CoA transferase [Candidatus Binataceae bacterium]